MIEAGWREHVVDEIAASAPVAKAEGFVDHIDSAEARCLVHGYRCNVVCDGA